MDWCNCYSLPCLDIQRMLITKGTDKVEQYMYA